MIQTLFVSSTDNADSETTRLAVEFFNLGVKHSNNKQYSDYKKILDQFKNKNEEFQVTFLLKVASLIDAYTYQNPPRK